MPELFTKKTLLAGGNSRPRITIPSVGKDLESVTKATAQIKELIEVLSRQRGNENESALTVGEFNEYLFSLNSVAGKTTDNLSGLTERVSASESDIAILNGQVDMLQNAVLTLQAAIVELVPSGYGGGAQTTVVPFTIPGGAGNYETVPFDSLFPTVNRGCVFQPGGNNMYFTVKGVWTAMLIFSLEDFNSFNSGRAFTIRMFNETTGTPGPGVIIGVGRNQQDLTFPISYLIDISEDSTVSGSEHMFRFEVGGGDAVTAGDLIAATLQVTHASELGALL